MSKSTTRESLIDAGLGLIHSAGYTATGINQVLEAAKVPKGSFYHHFVTKDEFVLEVIRRYVEGEDARWQTWVGDSEVSPLERLRAFFGNLKSTYGCSGGPIIGCLLGNISLEVAGKNEEIRALLAQAFDDWQSAIAAVIREAVEKGELPETVDADQRAALLVNGWEGAQVRAKAVQSDEPLEQFLDHAFGTLLRG